MPALERVTKHLLSVAGEVAHFVYKSSALLGNDEYNKI